MEASVLKMSAGSGLANIRLALPYLIAEGSITHVHGLSISPSIFERWIPRSKL